jgi:hypothetical protein
MDERVPRRVHAQEILTTMPQMFSRFVCYALCAIALAIAYPTEANNLSDTSTPSVTLDSGVLVGTRSRAARNEVAFLGVVVSKNSAGVN